MSKGNEPKQLTAAQRLIGLEQSVGMLDQALYNQTQQLSMAREALTLLNDKVNAIVALLAAGQNVSDSTIDQMIESNRIDSMKSKVQELLDANTLVKTEVVSEKSFLVVREMNSETGAVINPRLQFAVSILNPSSLEKLVGKKAGDSVKFVEDNSAVIEIEEIYDVVVQGVEMGESESSDLDSAAVTTSSESSDQVQPQV